METHNKLIASVWMQILEQYTLFGAVDKQTTTNILYIGHKAGSDPKLSKISWLQTANDNRTVR